MFLDFDNELVNVDLITKIKKVTKSNTECLVFIVEDREYKTLTFRTKELRDEMYSKFAFILGDNVLTKTYKGIN